MQNLIKGALNGIRLSGLNGYTMVRGFARMTGRSRKTFAQALEKTPEESELKEVDQGIKQKTYNPEDFDEEIEVPKPKKTVKVEKGKVNEDSSMVFQQQTKKLLESENTFKALEKDTKKFIKEELLYPGYDPNPEKLVQRPLKDVVWGLGGQLMKRRSKFFEEGKMPEVDEIIAFLEMEHAKDVVLVDLLEQGRTDLPRWGIILTAYSSRHMHRIGTALVKAIKELEIKDLVNPPRIHGRKDDDWIMVSCKNMMVHMFTEESRQDLDLEKKWTTPYQSDDEVDYEEMKKQSRRPKAYQTYKGDE